MKLAYTFSKVQQIFCQSLPMVDKLNFRIYSKIIHMLLFLSFFGLTSCVSAKKRVIKRDVINHSSSFNVFAANVMSKKPNLNTFQKRGPFGFSYFDDFKMKISNKETFSVDLLLSTAEGKAPLAVFVHGNKSTKETHSFQAQRLSSWGFHSLLIDLPNRHQWVKNGGRVGRIVKHIAKQSKFLGRVIDRNKIILVGHSFGGSASTIATGMGAPVSGLILLDPAVVSSRVKRYMAKVKVPVILLGADQKVYRAVKRDSFFRTIPTTMMELSFVNTTHEEAEFPSACALDYFGYECFSVANQRKFASAIILSAFSLTQTNNINYAWNGFKKGKNKGLIKKMKIKNRR